MIHTIYLYTESNGKAPLLVISNDDWNQINGCLSDFVWLCSKNMLKSFYSLIEIKSRYKIFFLFRDEFYER